MDETVQTQDPTYQVGGGTYRLETLSWQQHKWLAEQIFKDIDMHRLDYATVHDLLREKGPLFMAICLIDAGMSRAQHSRLSFADISQRADEFAAELTGGEVATFGIHFFRSCLASPVTMAMLTTGKGMQQVFSELAAPSPAPGVSGSSAASSHSAAAISPSSGPSSVTGGLLNPTPTSSGVLSERPSTEPSLAG
jgi:hypothetical protein